MTEQERAELKAELIQEIRGEMNITVINSDSSRCLQPVLDKWCNGENRHGYHGRHGALIELMPAYRGWSTWEHIRRLTCNIMNVSYVRGIEDIERARKIADKLCEVVVELVKEEQSLNRDERLSYDAIPVKWLREKMKKPLITSANPFDYVLDAWEQDNNVTPTCGPDYCEID